MKRDTFLGLDIGTLGVKGVIVTVDGQVSARARLDHGVSHPQPGWAEQDAEAQWWGDGVSVIRELLAVPGVDPARIAAIGVCGLTPCLCLIDADGRPLRPAILYSDNRALPQLARVRPPSVCHSLLRRSPRNGPGWPSMSRTWCVMRGAYSPVTTTLSTSLPACASMDYDTASIVGGVFDARRKAWDVSACAALGLDAGLLPPLRAATDVVGGVTPAAAQATGLRPGTPVIAGTGDTFPTIVGCGAVTPGDAMISFGTTGLLTLTTRPLETAAAGPHFEAEAEGGAVAWAANVLACGRLLAWYREAFGIAVVGAGLAPASGTPDFVLLDRCAAAIPAGCDGLVALPHLMGRRTPTPDPHARGVLFGLTPAHTAAHVYRALLESFGYAVRQGFDPIRPRTSSGSSPLPGVRPARSGARSWPTSWTRPSSIILGRAARWASRFWPRTRPGWSAASRPSAMTGSPAPNSPCPMRPRAECYDDLYRLYCHLDGSLSAAFAMLPSIRCA